MPAWQLHKVRQSFRRESIRDIDRAIRDEPGWEGLRLKPGARLAVAVGSRGIANLQRIVKSVIQILREKGAQPFIVPAMGSHGGATPEGQTALLASFGISESDVGCPIRSSMEVASLPAADGGIDLWMDRHAYAADGIVLINRIKPHTDFHGQYESGLVKMAVIGLGKERQASAIHRYGVHGLRELVPKAARTVFATGKIVLGLGIVENAYDETMRLAVWPGSEILRREPELLEVARANMPRLPSEKVDVLIVDRLGKNISGTGMDTNVIGRIRIRGEPEPAAPDIKSILVADLTEESHGNATGLGLADVTTRRLFEKIDFAITAKNVVTSSFLERGKIPLVADTDAEALEFALRSAGPTTPPGARVLRIRDTLHLDTFQASAAFFEEWRGRADLEMLGPAENLFDAKGRLREF
jgi:hypothetical protein